MSTLGAEPTQEEIFCYIYAVLYSPSYRKRYEEFLKVDFPRITLPTDYKLFKKLSELGKDLVELHLLKYLALQEREIEREIGFSCGGNDDNKKGDTEEFTC